MLFVILSVLVFVVFVVIDIKMYDKIGTTSNNFVFILMGFVAALIILIPAASIKPNLNNARLVGKVRLDIVEKDGKSFYVSHNEDTHWYSYGYTSSDGEKNGVLLSDKSDVKVIENGKADEAYLYVYEGNTSPWIVDSLNSMRLHIFVIPDGTFQEELLLEN